MADINPTPALLSGATRTASATACGAVGDTITFVNSIGATPDWWVPNPRKGAGHTGGASLVLVSKGASTLQFEVVASSSGQANVFGGEIVFQAAHTQTR